MLEKRIKAEFESRFKTAPETLIKSPGRINIIGEHTDYNMGYVLPAAINYYMNIGFAKNDKGLFRVYSIDYDTQYDIKEKELNPDEVSWLSLVKGIIFQLKDQVSGFDMVFGGEIPVGAGLSSSAALCCGTAYGINELFELNLKKWDMAKIAQKSEHDFVNVQCGIMDQFACLFGLTNHALMLDCETYKYHESEINISGAKFFLLNSNVNHSLNDSNFNARGVESALGLRRLQELDSSIKTFKGVSMELLKKAERDAVWWKRAHHVVTENQRVLAVSKALKDHKIEQVGDLINEGHASLRDYYEVTCPETDFLVQELQKEDIVHGARQVGGGFGGCILGLAKDKEMNQAINRVNTQYKKKFGLELTNIPIRISKGCHAI